MSSVTESISSASVICEEVFDDGFQLSSEEINEYAVKIGIDPETEPHLLYLAKEGLMQALPRDWKICYNDKLQAHYYYNEETKASQWDHPLDAIYRIFVDKSRQKLLSSSTTTITKSISITSTNNNQTIGIDISEELSQVDSGIRSLQGTENSDMNTNDIQPSSLMNPKKIHMENDEFTDIDDIGGLLINRSNTNNGANRYLDGRNKRVLIGLDPIRTSRFEVVPTNPQIDLDMKFNNDNNSIIKQQNLDDNNFDRKGYTISGTGAMFLKSNTKFNYGNHSSRQYFTETFSPTVKSILRDSSLTDVRRRYTEDSETEDKKSVRFNLDEIKLRTNYSPDDEPSSSRKFGQSPEISENSGNDDDEDDDDDDPWDFMEEDNNGSNNIQNVEEHENEQEEVEEEVEEEQEKHVKEIKVVPVIRNPLPLNILKPLLKPQISSDDILNKQEIKPMQLGRTFSAESTCSIGSSSILDKMKERNVVKPLYEDTDSDSRGSSVRSFIQKSIDGNSIDIHNDKNDLIIKEGDILKNHEENLEKLRQELLAEREAETERIREETEKILEIKKQELLQKNEQELLIIQNEKTKIQIDDNLENEKSILDNQCQEDLAKLREEKESHKKQQLEIENEKYENLLKEENEKLDIDYIKKLANINNEYDQMFETVKVTIEEDHNKKLEEYRNSLDQEFDEKRKKFLDEHKQTVDILQKNHSEILQDLERDLKSEEEIVKKEHLMSLSQMRDKLTHELEMERQRMRESGEDRLYEKIRCEKRLLEDKYRCLKEKYIRLKTDVKLSLERRNRRREQAAQQQSLTNTTTGSETERSTSNKPSIGSNSENRSASLSSPYIDHIKPPLTPKTTAISNNLIGKDHHHVRDKSAERQQIRDQRKLGIASKYMKQLQVHYQEDTTSISQSDTTISNNYPKGRYLPAPYNSDNGNSDSEAFHRNQENNNNPRDRQRKKLFSRMKSASTSRLNTENFKTDRPCTPVENLRRQLQKLEDLEDQFPDNTLDTTYHLRYPFSDISNDHVGTSSELEFFKHRIHLERDSVRRAKESLRTQRTNFRARQREVKQRHKASNTRHTLDQLIQEEKELTEMEVNLHRTRALLGEKVIRLRHLEQSLQRIYEKEKPMDFLQVENKDDAATLSDLSSHSSSGFSSTDFASDTNQVNINRRKEMYQESSECIQNLEILNAEIREILDILSKQQGGLTSSPQFLNSDWPILSPGSQQNNSSALQLHAPQSIPTLADRLETYRQLAAGRVQTSIGGSVIAANTIVSQNPRAVNYTTSLVERTRDLRNWLRQAKNEHDFLSGGANSIGTTVPTGPGPQVNL